MVGNKAGLVEGRTVSEEDAQETAKRKASRRPERPPVASQRHSSAWERDFAAREEGED
jgi:hypothetical protein